MMQTMNEYDRTNCPYCGVAFDPLPRAKKRCPSCGEMVWVRAGPDGRRYILREVDLAAHEARWDDEMDRRAAAEDARISREAARLAAEALRSYADGGIQEVEMFGAEDACPACAAVAGRRYVISAAPRIPVPGCGNEICRCDYVAVID